MTTKHEDEAFDENGVARDGHGVKVAMTMMDEDNPAAPPPGYRLGTLREQVEEAAKTNTILAPMKPDVQKAYEANNARVSEAWKTK